MANSEPARQLAVLIDGDNIPAGLANMLFTEVAKRGTIAIRRVYARSSGISDWREQAKAHCISLRETMPGKNSTDIELAIDAMDLLHRGRLDGYCIVSSDRDFAPLARRLREDGMLVTGYGMQKAADEVRPAFDSFVVLKPPAKAPKAEKTVAAVVSLAPTPVQNTPKTIIGPLVPAERLILKALGEIGAGRKWIAIETVHQQLLRLDPKFKPNAYGCSKLSVLVDAIDGMETNSDGKSTKMRMTG